MNQVISLIEDKLSDHIWDPKVIVVYSSTSCGKCLEIKPKLYDINEEYKIIIVNSTRHFNSNKYYPTELLWFPTVAYYENGTYIKDINTKEIEEGLWN
jgi:thiol-disulfide isomerase/thioredoxin